MKTKIENPKAFKNWINEDLLKRMAAHLKYHAPSFDEQALIEIAKKFSQLELKDRVRCIKEALHQLLPYKYTQSVSLLLKSVEKPKPKVLPLKGFDLWPYTEFIQEYGISEFETSMKALHFLTQKFTAEFAVRPFFKIYQDETLKTFHTWAVDPDHHVRRLVSEGSRPRLPWGERLDGFIEQPELTIQLLEKLKYDDEIYVRKSVANHLNDISKDSPDLVVDILSQWQKAAPSVYKERISWITKHALRSLLKQGHRRALTLLGFKNQKSFSSPSGLKLAKKKLKVGEILEFSIKIKSRSKSTQKVMIDYVVHHKKANGKTSPKVFKWRVLQIDPGNTLELKKKHVVRKVTTRRYYPGEQRLTVLVNGQSVATASWQLS